VIDRPEDLDGDGILDSAEISMPTGCWTRKTRTTMASWTGRRHERERHSGHRGPGRRRAARPERG
jgi:hypothetical protein